MRELIDFASETTIHPARTRCGIAGQVKHWLCLRTNHRRCRRLACRADVPEDPSGESCDREVEPSSDVKGTRGVASRALRELGVDILKLVDKLKASLKLGRRSRSSTDGAQLKLVLRRGRLARDLASEHVDRGSVLALLRDTGASRHAYRRLWSVARPWRNAMRTCWRRTSTARLGGIPVKYEATPRPSVILFSFCFHNRIPRLGSM